MLATTWCRSVCLIASAYLCSAAVGATLPAPSVEPGTTKFGRSLFAVLDDPDPLIRRRGWTSLEVLGSLSAPNELHTETFKRFLERDGRGLAQRIELLLGRVRGELADGDSRSNSDGSEFAALRQTAFGVPEIAALVANSLTFSTAVHARDLEDIKSASARARPKVHPVRLTSRPDRELAALIALVRSPTANDRDSRSDAFADPALAQRSISERVQQLTAFSAISSISRMRPPS
jgi:hypothetical protein